MADLSTPQLEKGHTRVANELLLKLAATFHGRTCQLAIMLVVMRFSYGYQRKKAFMTISEFATILGTNRTSIRRALKELEAGNMLIVTPRPGHHRKAYQVQKNWKLWVGHRLPWVIDSHGSQTPTKGVIDSQLGGSQTPTSKKTKKITKKGDGYILEGQPK